MLQSRLRPLHVLLLHAELAAAACACFALLLPVGRCKMQVNKAMHACLHARRQVNINPFAILLFLLLKWLDDILLEQ
jgi:hypothetical protein